MTIFLLFKYLLQHYYIKKLITEKSKIKKVKKIMF